MKYLLAIAALATALFCAAEPPFNVATLYGKWIVMDSFDSSGVSALSTEENKAMHGKVITLDKSKFELGGNVCANPSYDVSFISRRELLRNIHYVDSRESGLPSKVKQIDAGCVDVFIKNENSILFVWEGDIFAANRK